MRKLFLTFVSTVAVISLISSCNNLNSDFAGPGTHWVVSAEESTNFHDNDTLPNRVYTFFTNLNYNYFGYMKVREDAINCFDEGCEYIVGYLKDTRLPAETYCTLVLYMITNDKANPQEVKRTKLNFDVESN